MNDLEMTDKGKPRSNRVASWSIVGLLKKVVALEDKIKPSILLSKPQIHKETRPVGLTVADGKVKTSSGKKMDVYCVRFKVTNIGGQFLKECLVKLVEMNPLPNGMSARDLPIGIPTERQQDKQWAGRFKLGLDEYKYLTLLELAANSPIHLIMEGEKKTLSRDKKYTMKLVAYSELTPSEPIAFTGFVDKKGVLCVDGS